ncbi:MAG: TraB/GumN family protein [Cyclobacteriaceae bacterium]|nr:TraB/GumN family protein [Cyclobacteriaceae bacterium]MCH8517330.1 TraB/GumN family protein [Cyclobacteriaceae bacterium]
MNRKSQHFLQAIIFCFIVFLSTVGIGANQPEKALLWKITGNELEQPSYLFGTIHLICPDDFFIEDSYLEAFKKSRTLVLELDPMDPEVVTAIQLKMMNEGMANIKQYISEENLEAVDSYLKTNFMAGIDQLGIIKPFFLSTMIMSTMLDCEQPDSYELYFRSMAMEKEIPIKSLETVSDQLSIFENIPIQDQVKDLEKTILDIENSQLEFHHLVNAYKAKDLSALYDLIQNNEMMNTANDDILVKRNKAWIPQIEEIIRQGTAFIAVGAGHLPAADGVIELLREQGFTVEAVE